MLYNEAVDMARVANSIISHLHHFFANHSFGRTACIHPDNCVGQKLNNNAMLAVLDMPNLSPNLNSEVAKLHQ